MAVIGCGSTGDIVAVEGTLTYDGQPVPDMIVRFAPEGGRASEGRTAADGSFEMSYAMDRMGVEPGNHRVTVDWSPPTDEIGVKPDPLAQKVLDDFQKNGPIAATAEKSQSSFEIKLPR
jgi:hypothetical protein